MTSAEWAVVATLIVGAYVFIFGVLKVLMDAIGKERAERQTAMEVERIERQNAVEGERLERQAAMAEHEKQDETRRDKVLEKLDEVEKSLSEKIDGWAERVGTRLGDHNQRITRLETKAEK